MLKGDAGDVRRGGGRKTESNTLVHRTSSAAVGHPSRTASLPLPTHGGRKTLVCAHSAPRRRQHSLPLGASIRISVIRGVMARACDERCQLLDDRRETTSASASTTPHRHFSQTICLREAAQPCAPESPGELVPLGVRLTALSLAEAVGGCTGWGCNETGVPVVVVGGGRDDVAGGAGDTPRSFCAMFGTSRAVGVQYCKSRSCQRVGLPSRY